MREERKIVTALFSDLVGSTALAEQLDPEDVRDVVGGAIECVILAVEELGGTVKDLAGDGVLALFGAPDAHEDDAERAVLSGLRIVERIREYAEEIARERGIDGLAVRVGIETGLVVLGPVGAGARVEYGATGDAVNVTARLQSAAEPGTVLVGETTRRQVEPLFTWGRRRELELKGKTVPVVASEATGIRATSLQRRGIPGVEAPFVGRERELTRARAEAARLARGEGSALLIVGEPGLGKSRLIAELRRLVDGDARWLEGRCVSYGQTLPYWPYRQLLRDWLGLSPADPDQAVATALRGQLGDDANWPYLAAVLGLPLPQELAELSPEAVQYRTFETVRALLERLAHEEPLVVAIEDLHWADPTSVQLTETLVGLAGRAPLLLVVAQRPERDHASYRLLETADEEDVIQLDALPDEAESALLHALVGETTLPGELEGRLLKAAEGNPFFLEELVRSLVDAGALVREDGGFRFDHEVPVEVPETVEKVILTRIDRLAPTARDALTAACVLGREFGLELLRAVAGGNSGLVGGLAELERLDLLRQARPPPQPEYRFKHALIQEAAYRSLLRRRRQELHRRAAEAIETLFRDRLEQHYGVLGHHWRGAGELERALDYHTRAAAASRRVFAVEEALGHYSEALELAGSLGTPTGGLHLERGIVRAQTGRISLARADLEQAVAQTRAAGDKHGEMEALNELAFLLAGAADYGESIPLFEGALGLAETLDDRRGLASVLSRLSIVHTNRLELDRAVDHSHRALGVARELGDRYALALALDSLVVASVMVGDFLTVDDCARRLIDIHRARGDLWYLQWALYQWSWEATGRARWGEALSRLEEGREINRRIADSGGTAVFLATVAWIHRAQGEYERALRFGREAVDCAREVGHPEMIAWSGGTLGWTLLEVGAFEEADEHLRAGLKAADAAGAQIEVIRAVAHLARVCSLRGEVGHAYAFLQRAEELFGQVTAPPGRAYLQGADAPLAAARVRLARGEPHLAEALVEPVLEAAEAAGWQEVIAEASLVLGRSRGDRSLLEGALALAEEHGLAHAGWEARAALGRTAEARVAVELLSQRLADARIRATFVRLAEAELKRIGDER